jgi:NitT/TauT family transport system substrate-binding protein
VLDRGELDVLVGSVSLGFFNAVTRGAKIKMVADKGYISSTGCAFNTLLIRKELVESGGIKDLSQLRNRKLALQMRGNFGEYHLEAMLKSAGLTLNDVEVVYAPGAANFEAMKSGKIDVWYAVEPWVSKVVEAEVGEIWSPSREMLSEFPVGAIFYGPNLLEKDPEAGRGFMIAYLKAVQKYNQGKTDRNLEIVDKYLDMGREPLKQACWVPIHEDGKINVQSVLDFQTWGLEKKLLDAAVKTEQFWDTTFVDHASKSLKAQAQ